MTPLRALGAWGIVIAVLVGGCGGDPAPMQAAVDALSLPANWEETKTIAKGPCITVTGACPRVTRYYIVAGELPDLFQEARSALVAGGFGDLQELFPDCEERNTSGSLCSVSGTKADWHIQVDLYESGKDVDSLGISVPDQPTVRITIY